MLSWIASALSNRGWLGAIDALRDSPIGELVPISGQDGRTGEHYEYFAYLAAPLPASIELSSGT